MVIQVQLNFETGAEKGLLMKEDINGYSQNILSNSVWRLRCIEDGNQEDERRSRPSHLQ